MATNETVVVKLVVAADGALTTLANFDKGMTAAANASVKAGAGVDAFTAQIARQRTALEAGVPVLKARTEIISREQRTIENAMAKIDGVTKARLGAERELGRVVVASSNLVADGKMSEADAIRQVTMIEEAHVAQINKVISAQYGLADAVDQTRAEYAALATAERLAATSADGQRTFNSLAGVRDGAEKSARDAASVFSAELDRLDEIANLKALQAGATFAAALEQSLIAGTGKSARESAAVFEAELSRLDDIARLKATETGQAFNNALNASFGIGSQGKSARDSAAVFEEAAREADAYAARLAAVKGQIDPLSVSTARYNAEMAEYNIMLRNGDLSTTQFAQAVAAAKAKLEGTAASIRGNAAAVQSYNRSASGASFQTSNIAAQFQDIAVSAQMGMSPMMIALQQGTQLSAVLNGMQNPIKALGGALMSVLNPVSLLTIGFVGLAAVAASWVFGMINSNKDAATALEEHNKWLDSILAGYDDIREAAKTAADEAQRLPHATLDIELTAGLAEQAKEAEKLDRKILDVRDSFTKVMSILLDLQQIDINVGGDGSGLAVDIDKVKVLQDIALSAKSSREELNAAQAAASELFFTADDPAVKDLAEQVYLLTKQLQALNAEAESTVAAKAMNSYAEFAESAGPGVADALARITKEAADLRVEKQSLDAQFASDAMGARTMGELRSIVAAYENLKRGADAAAWAVKNSGDAAVVAAGQYGTAEGAANSYANALWRLGSAIPAVAAAQGAYMELKQAESDYSLGVKANGDLLKARGISLDEYARRQTDLTERYKQAQDAISGVSAVEEQLAQTQKQNGIDALEGREQALARVNLQYEEQAKKITDLASTGASQAKVDELLAQNNQQLEAALGNTNAQFDRMASAKGAKGAGAALKAAQQDFESFVGTADKLAEKLFPGEYAAREAEQLKAMLNKYRGQLDDFQVQAVVGEIDSLNQAADLGLRRLEDRANDAAKEIESTLGAALSSLFSEPIKDIDDFVKKVMDAFAQLGNANLSKFFDGALGGGSPEDKKGGLATLLSMGGGGSGAVPVNVENTKDFSKGLAGILKDAAPMVSAGLGGLGIGYQTQNPIMGALGGAMAGAAAGPWGMAIGAIAGLAGGLFGMWEAAEKAKKALKENIDAINQFIATGFGEAISSYTSAVTQFAAQGKKLIELAEAAGDSALVGRIQSAIDAYKTTLGGEFVDSINRSLNDLRGEEYLNEVADAQKTYNQRLADAEYLGVSAAGAQEELSRSLRKIIIDAGLTAVQMQGLAAAFPALADALAGLGLVGGNATALYAAVEAAKAQVEDARQNVREAYEREADALKTVIDRTKDFITSLKQFRAGLRLDDAVSPLAPFDKLVEAQRQFSEVTAKAAAGDKDAMGRVEDVSRQYLEAARSYYADSTQYFAIFEQVESVLDATLSKAETQLSTAEKQLTALDAQVDLLASIDDGVMSLSDALANLAAALDVQMAAQQTYDQGSGFSAEVNKIYKDVLGRAPDADGAQYWQKRFDTMSTAEVYQQFIRDVINLGATPKAAAVAQWGIGETGSGPIPAYATGTLFHPGGRARVSENGRGEVLDLPRGTRVYPHDVSMRMATGNDRIVAVLTSIEQRIGSLETTTANGAAGTTQAVRDQAEEQSRASKHEYARDRALGKAA